MSGLIYKASDSYGSAGSSILVYECMQVDGNTKAADFTSTQGQHGSETAVPSNQPLWSPPNLDLSVNSTAYWPYVLQSVSQAL